MLAEGDHALLHEVQCLVHSAFDLDGRPVPGATWRRKRRMLLPDACRQYASAVGCTSGITACRNSGQLTTRVNRYSQQERSGAT
jgi:hypothetical protein